jgi:hypothetical protein
VKANGTFKLRHRYDERGRYKVKLAVKGAEGKTATATRNARVKRAKG